ncbi:HEAT repeat domain-containing protein, partial [Streptomyces sp. SID11385]|uniref:HEAT repeat domain-containing protein n=1 Tax=Streptomyces sp. SID11385 TaxID=2706031 RepID=UPI0013CB2C40
RAGESALAPLARGLGAPEAAVRERAARSLAALPADDGTTALLREVLDHPDADVRDHAALALGARGHAEAVPALVAMVAAGRRDVDAGEALSRLAGGGGGRRVLGAGSEGGVGGGSGAVGGGAGAGGDAAVRERVAGLLAGCVVPGAAEAPVRRRIAQALADIPGESARRTLTALTRDDDRGVAVTAAYGLGRRGSGGAG